MSTGRKPDYRFRAYHKTTKASGEVGAAWLNEDKSLSISLNPGAFLMYDPEIVLRLFPADSRPTAPGEYVNKGGVLEPLRPPF